jgi:5-methylcytosine-specific restriction endonuclease McrA
MPGDRFYLSETWRKLRSEVLLRDGRRCVVCGAPGVLVDHIVPRKAGGQDVAENLRTLCRACDNARHAEKRAPHRVAVGADGWPICAGVGDAKSFGPSGQAGPWPTSHSKSSRENIRNLE